VHFERGLREGFESTRFGEPARVEVVYESVRDRAEFAGICDDAETE
jgi:hypothetical protein